MKERIRHLSAAPRVPVERNCRPSVYALYRNDVIVYVGSSVNVESRVRQHVATEKDFDSYSFVAVKTVEEMHELEVRCIAEFSPEYNMGFASTAKSGFTGIGSLKTRYAAGMRELKKTAHKAGVEVLHFQGTTYYNIKQMDVAMGVNS